MTRTFLLGPTDIHRILFFFGFFITDTAAPLPSSLTNALASPAPVLRTRTRHQHKEVGYSNTGADDARAVVNSSNNGASIGRYFDHTVYSCYHIPEVSSQSVYVMWRVYLILYFYST